MLCFSASLFLLGTAFSPRGSLPQAPMFSQSSAQPLLFFMCPADRRTLGAICRLWVSPRASHLRNCLPGLDPLLSDAQINPNNNKPSSNSGFALDRCLCLKRFLFSFIPASAQLCLLCLVFHDTHCSQHHSSCALYSYRLKQELCTIRWVMNRIQ